MPDLVLAEDVGRLSGTDVYAVPVLPGPTPGFGAAEIEADLPAFLADCGCSGKAGEVAILPRPGGRPRTVYLVGVGAQSPADLRLAAAALARSVDPEHGVRRVVTTIAHGADAAGFRAIVEAVALATYRFSEKSTPRPAAIRTVTLVVDTPNQYADALAAGLATARATRWTRDLANTPSGTKTPAWLAAQAEATLTGPALSVAVRKPAALDAEGFDGILAVGAGSSRGPRLIEVRYRPPRARGRHVVLLGKGITFDTGGISIKPNEGMHLMKTDMAGGAAVLGAVRAAAELALPVSVTVLVPAAENHVSGSAYRPGDVIRHYGGRTTEVRNTDAEGRVVLADALAYAVARLRPGVLIDVATLTGAMKLALGVKTAGILGTDAGLTADLLAAAGSAGEPMWELPLVEDYACLVDSDIADGNNAAGNPGGITAALFLRPFAGGLPWAHLDIAGPARAGTDDGEISKGASGYGVRTLVHYLEREAAS